MNEGCLIYIKYGRARYNSRSGAADTARDAAHSGEHRHGARHQVHQEERETSEEGRTLPVAGFEGGRGHRNVSFLFILIHSMRSHAYMLFHVDLK